jgi:hypothetical protein
MYSTCTLQHCTGRVWLCCGSMVQLVTAILRVTGSSGVHSSVGAGEQRCLLISHCSYSIALAKLQIDRERRELMC